MPTSPNGLAALNSINRPKAVHITAADNGYVITLDQTTSYDQKYKVAKDASEVAEIITAYFA